jgi:hypothetical protein
MTAVIPMMGGCGCGGGRTNLPSLPPMDNLESSVDQENCDASMEDIA